MQINKCQRCGNFFTTEEEICANCISKDNLEISTLKKFFIENPDNNFSLEDISSSTGISMKNLSRLSENNEIHNFLNTDNTTTKSFGNISINL